MRVIASRGSQTLVVDSDTIDQNTLGWIVDDPIASEVPVWSALARGYWEEAEGDAVGILDGKILIPWSGNT